MAEELHFGRAAERLRMTQPPLSRQIQLLENELGVTLFDRSNRTVRLTRTGRAFLPEARRLLRQAEQAARTARSASSGEIGSLALGFTAASAYRTLGAVLDVIRKNLPGAEIILREMAKNEQLEALSDRSLDLGMMVRPPIRRHDLESRIYVREPLVVAIPVGHSLAKSPGPVTVADFDGESVIMYRPAESRYFHDLLISVFRNAGCTPVFSHYLSQIHSVLALVNTGFGLSLVPAAATQLRYPDVVFRPIELSESSQVELSLVWRRNNDNPVLTALLDHLFATGG
ncbi:DNA-binding transcriptional LysR family regulator [Saccharopolyspora phatthalungensis]|uniref:DNA-binding transcriptional LysR family regulator n=1 Tax=Saccharopolyspora phatthalungensis TaxID=664693 RepID=A0A840QBN2_9PSEU|nr:DNA-binding transcriptional LysR family regulator [Saccharopolyspora phatthalungensis]